MGFLFCEIWFSSFVVLDEFFVFSAEFSESAVTWLKVNEQCR